MIDTIKLASSYGTAAVLAIGGTVMLFVAWLQPIDPQNPRDLAILFGVLGGIIGSSTGFLWNQEAAKSATRAAQASAAAASTQANVVAGIIPPS